MEREKEREREPSLSRVAARDVARGCLLSLAVHFSLVSLSLSLSLFFLLLIPSSPFSPFNLSLSLSLFLGPRREDEAKGGGEGRKKRNADKRREREREKERRGRSFSPLPLYRRGLATHSLLSISLSLSLSKSPPCPARAGWPPPSRTASSNFSLFRSGVHLRSCTRRHQQKPATAASLLFHVCVCILSLSLFLSVFLSVGARSREPATGRINSHARVSVAVSVHGPLLPPSHLVPLPFSPSLLSFLLPSLP